MVVAKESTVEGKSEIQIPIGKAKSGRDWKVRQTSRSSTQTRQGILSHLAKTFEEKEIIRNKLKEMKLRETEMTNDKKRKIADEIARREEQTKRRKENEYKTSVYQAVSCLK